MNAVMVILFALFLSGFKFSEQNQFFGGYCSIRQSNAIKGIFVILIFLSHGMDYFPLTQNDIWVREMSEYLKQHIVVPFLFYSGFGVMESIQRKGYSYIRSIPFNRVLKTIIFADISVLTFALFYLIIGREFSVGKLLLSLVFWDKIGNNTWYFFVIVFLYLFTYISFRIFNKNYYLAAVLTAVLSMFLFFFLIRYKSIIWYNTFFCYHFGMWYSLLRSKIEPIVMRNDLIYFIALLIAFLAYLLFRSFGSFYYFIICGCWLMTLIVGLTMKIKVDNPFLQFLGTHVLGFYSLHRIPMMIASPWDMALVYKFVFCFLVTCILVLIHESITKWIDRRLFCRFQRHTAV